MSVVGRGRERMEWHFRAMSDGEINVDPIEGEFFTIGDIESLADGLVREAIQNSLDARIPGQQVRVRFHFSGPQIALSKEERTPFLRGMRRHLESRNSGIATPPREEEGMDFLLIEDFGTSGLEGDPEQVEDADAEDTTPKNDFFYFWRNIGRTAKGETDLGRWGLGKTVFQAASRINAFFGFTRRAEDGRCLLMGQSVLKIHWIDGTRYAPYGYFAHVRGDLALPCEHPQELQRFCDAFWVRRDEPGLSIAIPYLSTEITVELIERSVMRHYFVPILTGDLVVEIGDGIVTRTIDGSSLRKKSVDDALIALADQALTHRVKPLLCGPPSRGKAPRWSSAVLQDSVVDQGREALARNGRVVFDVPVWVARKGEAPAETRFLVALERDGKLKRGESAFVRDGIRLAGIHPALPSELRAFVYVRDRILSRFLGDSENPAHTEWQERSPKFKDAYELGPSTLRYIKNAPRELWDLLTRPAEGRDQDLLGEIFSIEADETEPATVLAPSRAEEPGVGAAAEDAGEVAGTDPSFNLTRIAGGFRVSMARGARAVPDEVVIRVAFEVRRGNPFSHYSEYDFVLDEEPIVVMARNAEIVERNKNRLRLKPEGRGFGVVVKGFDVRRDLRVRVEAGRSSSRRTGS